MLQGNLFQELIAKHLGVKTFAECSIPLAITVWDIVGFRTNVVDSGDLPRAVRASCTFPLLFQPCLVRVVFFCCF